MTNKEIREEMMLQIEQLKTINILNRLGMHNKDEEQTKVEIKSRTVGGKQNVRSR